MLPKPFLLITFSSILLSSYPYAQTVSLSGTVFNTDNVAVRGAVVALQNGKLSDTTDANGVFSITGNVGVVSVLPKAGVDEISVCGGFVRFSLVNDEQVFLSVFDCTGRILTSLKQFYKAGNYSIDLGRYAAHGLKIIRVAMGQPSYSFKMIDMEGSPSRPITQNHAQYLALSKRSASVDSLKVNAVRYWPLSQGVNSYNQSNINLIIASLIDTGVGASFHGVRPFPDDNPWNTPVDKDTVDPLSDRIIAGIGLNVSLHPDFCGQYNGGVCGIPYVVVTANTPRSTVTFDYADESDPGPYPIPANPPIEGGPSSTGDRHILMIDRDSWILYELYSAYPPGTGWTAGSGAIFKLDSDSLRQAGWTSADAAGLPIFPGLVRYDEVVEQKAVLHAVRFTVVNSRHAYLPPATHYASNKTADTLPPMGMRVRLKASVDISGYSANMQVILKALKTYGMIMADNGSNWYVSGAPDSRFDDNELNTLKQIKGSNFEVVKMRGMVTQ
ncbi:MAG TPA: carboxypeptidase-like regulatory domain-containing protein [Chitinivibrionales bacterium]|nr:carboxypeptidase-like regulatory domain-containing protein [Chitinivibrionales bacterium]